MLWTFVKLRKSMVIQKWYEKYWDTCIFLYLILVPNNFLGRKEKQEGHFVSAIFYVENRDFHLKLNFLYQIDGEILFFVEFSVLCWLSFFSSLVWSQLGSFWRDFENRWFSKSIFSKVAHHQKFFEMKDF